MDTAYDELRRQARAKRDKIIQSAQHEYRAALSRINALQKMVTGEARPAIRPPRRTKDRNLKDFMLEVLPKDRAFTVAQACDYVYQEPLGAQYKENSIRSTMRTLEALGLFRKVGVHRGHVQWAHVDAQVHVCPFAGMQMGEIVEQLIGERGPLRVAEIAAILKERGFRPNESNQVTYNTVLAVMTRTSGRFEKDHAGRWMLPAE